VQNVDEITQSVDELWPKSDFRDGGCRRLQILKISVFGHVTIQVQHLLQCTEFHQNRAIFD